MVRNTTETGTTISKMGKATWYMRMVMLMMEDGKATWQMATESTRLSAAIGSRGIGKTT